MKLNNKGFTLVELIAAVVIITILTIIVSSNVLGSLKSGKEKSYEILIENIATASQELYEEVYANELLGVSDTSVLYKYKPNGEKTNNKIKITSNSYISINLQTLVSNGFLSGSNNTETGAKKVILNPKSDEKENIGGCEISITRNSNSNGKVTYTITATNEVKINGNNICPTTEDYQKGVN